MAETAGKSGGVKPLLLSELDDDIEALIDLDPNTLNLKSKGRWIICYVELPDGQNIEQIDLESVLLTSSGGMNIPSELIPTELGDYDSNSVSDLMIKFDRSA